MKRLILFMICFYSSLLSANTTQYYITSVDASSACVSALGGSCGAGSGGPSNPSCTSSGATWQYSFGVAPNASIFVGCRFGNLCRADQIINIATGACDCPAGKHEESGACVNNPPECTSPEVTQLCESNVCVGTYQPSITCWLSPANAPSGCEAGYKTSSGCPAVCLGESTEDPVTHACIDPTCTPPLALQDHSCVDLVCIGGQIKNPSTGACDEPVCGVGYTLNTSSHYCDFSGCPSGYTQGSVNGITQCIKNSTGTITTSPPSGPESTTVTPDGNGGNTTVTTNPDGSVTTTITVVNPDGSQSITTTTAPGPTGGTGGTTSEIELDTSGLAQESTVQEGVQAQKDLLDLIKGQGATISTGQVGDLYDGTSVSSYSDSLTEFKNRVSSSTVGSSASGLFSVSFVGSCPAWQIPATDWTPPLTIDQICSPAMEQVWPWVYAVVLASATFMAIRWAFL
jgi:hypothetical protein